jgi:outer membrane receptor protein involved in Fe transport
MNQFLKQTLALFLVAVLLAGWCGVANAGTTGKLAGEVHDKESKEPLPGVNVVLDGTTIGGTTDANGRYYILLIAPGTYSISASIIGYQTVKVTNVKVNVDLTTTVNFELSSQTLQIGEQVEIIAERPLIQKDGVTTMQVTDAEAVSNMVADDFKDALTLNSGITTAPLRDGAFSSNNESTEGLYFVRGGRGNELGILVDGMYVRDGITGGLGTEIANSAIEELQLISGNFNAEYGNAMSGVLNIVTQEGGRKTSFRVRALTDALFGQSTRDYTFDERDHILEKEGKMNRSNWGTYQGEFSVGGPLLGDKLKYFLTGEYFETDGYIGVLQNEFSRRGSAKLTFAPSPRHKLALSTNLNSEDLEIYEHLFAHDELVEITAGDTVITPPNYAGNDRFSTRNIQGLVAWTHTLSPKAFYELKAQYFSRQFYDRVKSDPLEYDLLTYNDSEDFAASGDDPVFLKQEDRVLQAKFDFTWQADINNNVKGGLDFAKHRIWRKQLLAEGDIQNTRVDQYTIYPVEAAAYIQDKLELKDLVINAGLRLDFFDPRDSVAVDPNQPLGQRELAKSTWRLSPRVGLAHPISETSNLHFSYGHFYQVPEYNKIAFNRQRYVDIFRPTLGFAGLKPQRTIAFEVGWDQQLTDFLALTLTGFYKDYENLVSTDPYPNARPAAVTYYINQDFANSRGFELNLRTRRANHIASYFSYTLSRAEGNSSNPLDTRNDLLARPPRVPVKQLIILNWDRPHVFNFNIDFRYANNEGPLLFGSRWLENFGVNLTGRFESGFPYTPTDSRGQRIADENTARMPSTWQLDLRLDKFFNAVGAKLGIFAEVVNLTDRRNIVNVFTDSGLPNDSTDPGYTPQGERDPYNIGPQRNIRLGFELNY